MAKVSASMAASARPRLVPSASSWSVGGGGPVLQRKMPRLCSILILDVSSDEEEDEEKEKAEGDDSGDVKGDELSSDSSGSGGDGDDDSDDDEDDDEQEEMISRRHKESEELGLQGEGLSVSHDVVSRLTGFGSVFKRR